MIKVYLLVDVGITYSENGGHLKVWSTGDGIGLVTTLGVSAFACVDESAYKVTKCGGFNNSKVIESTWL